MKEPVSTEAQTQPVTFTATDLLDWIFTEPPERNMLHVTVTGPSEARPTDFYFRARDYGSKDGRRWHRADGGHKLGQEPGLDDLLAEHRIWARVGFAPILKTQMDGTCLARWPVLWVARNVRTFLARSPGAAATVDRDDLAQVVERFSTAPIPSHTLLDEGSRVIGLWRLDQPFEDKEDEVTARTPFEVIARVNSPTRARRGVRLLWKLAHVFHADVAVASRPEEFFILFPEQKDDLLHPPHVIRADCRDPKATVSIESLEEMAEGMAH